MNSSQAKTLAVASVGTSAVLASLEHVAKGKRPPVTVAIGAAVTGVILLALADPAPQLAGGLAGLLLVGAVLRNGVAASAALSQTFDK